MNQMAEDEISPEEYLGLAPEHSMTVEEFANKAKNLLDEMVAEHHDRTGVETQDWPDWIEDLSSAYLNS